ncbi:MAG: hypothetical protein GX610_15860 [Rhodococcus sp.]|nr:hypothetical protein [Rhodococcus sp. (in: high G+C Gram-positive bacteria)]
MNRECGRCSEAEGLDHCHGTLILHTDGSAECTDELCVREIEARHQLIVDCADLIEGCGCAEWLAEAYSRAS